MPLENDIQGLTAAINRLADVFAGTAAQVAAGRPEGEGAAKASAETETPKAKPAAKAEKAAPAKAAKPEPKKVEPKAEDDDLGDTGGEQVDFETVKATLRELGSVMTERKGPTDARQITIDLLGEFKVAKAIELKPAQYAAFIARATALINDDGAGAAEGEDDLIG